jgi:hypothetical protein
VVISDLFFILKRDAELEKGLCPFSKIKIPLSCQERGSRGEVTERITITKHKSIVRLSSKLS